MRPNGSLVSTCGRGLPMSDCVPAARRDQRGASGLIASERRTSSGCCATRNIPGNCSSAASTLSHGSRSFGVERNGRRDAAGFIQRARLDHDNRIGQVARRAEGSRRGAVEGPLALVELPDNTADHRVPAQRRCPCAGGIGLHVWRTGTDDAAGLGGRCARAHGSPRRRLAPSSATPDRRRRSTWSAPARSTRLCRAGAAYAPAAGHHRDRFSPAGPTTARHGWSECPLPPGTFPSVAVSWASA